MAEDAICSVPQRGCMGEMCGGSAGEGGGGGGGAPAPPLGKRFVRESVCKRSFLQEKGCLKIIFS